MRRMFVLLLGLFFAACAGKPSGPPASDAAWRWKLGAVFDVQFTERLSHEPRRGAEKPAYRSTEAQFVMTTVAVDAAGRALVRLSPVASEISVRAFGRPPVTHAGWLDRDREFFDLSPGALYLRDVAERGIEAVVDAEGRWLRDVRNAEVPPDFFAREKWGKPPPGVTVYPRSEIDKAPPFLFGVHIPTDWRTNPRWTDPCWFAPHPPMTGVIPMTLTTTLAARDGATLTLRGAGQPAGKPRTEPLFGLIQFGEATIDLQLRDATLEAQFDLNHGVPLGSRLDLRWSSQRKVDGIGEVISDDSQSLEFHVRPRAAGE
jgi:hypothetical protein